MPDMANPTGVKINGYALRAIREAKGLTATQCAKRAGVTQGAWSNWEANRRPVSYENLFRLLAAAEIVDKRAIVWDDEALKAAA